MESSRTSTVTRETRTYETSVPVAQPTNYGRSLVITRTIGGTSPGSRTQIERQTQNRNVYSGAPHGAYAAMTTTGVNDVKESRDREKKDMQDLNERFANYIDKVRYLEAQNRKLADDLDKLKTKWGKETAQVKAMFQAELDEARKALDEAEKEKARLEIRVTSLEEQIEELRLELTDYIRLSAEYNERLARQNQQLIDYENEIQLLRKRISTLETDRDKDRKMIEALQEALAKAREDLDNETLNHIHAENRRQTLEEEIEFLKQIHDQEMKELTALVYRDTAPENRDFWKNEMAQAIREIQQMYEDKMDTMKGELESHYNHKVQEFRTGATKQNIEATKAKEDSTKHRQDLTDLRDRLSDLGNRNGELQRILEQLRREKEDRERQLEMTNAQLQAEAARLKQELDAILKELQRIMDTKLGLELEIAAYRKLLEGEENRLSLKSVMESMQSSSGGGGGARSGGGMYDESMGSIAKGEISAKTTYQKSAKGAIAICECPPDGKFVQLENTGTKDENCVGWKITRTVDGKEIPSFELDQRFSAIRPKSKVTFYAKGSKPKYPGQNDHEVPHESWGIGASAFTRLINKDSEERATNIQKTVYSS